ncbi:MAG: hypothetical protein HY548_00625 [Elusimicrobia bacterium]|nr:hypothetical protein [Elusimicrobiota bacterium]
MILKKILFSLPLLLSWEAGVAVSSESGRMLSQARSHRDRGHLFWACEAWQASLKGNPASRAARENLAQILRRADTVLSEEGRSGPEKAYFQALRKFLLLDCSTLWGDWEALEKEPRFAEEMRWFLWGPSKIFYQKASGDASWEIAAARFREGWGLLEVQRWGDAKKLFTETKRLQPDHFLADPFSALCDMKLASKKKPASRAPAAETTNGPFETDWNRGESAFRAGRWPEALAIFKSLSRRADISETDRRRAVRAAQRLEAASRRERL